MSNNGNGNGHNSGGNHYKRLMSLLEEKRYEVEALETTMRLLNGKAQHSATARAKTTFDQALELDAARRESHGMKKVTVQQGRQLLLEQFDLKVPRPAPEGMHHMIPVSFMRYGYLKKRKDGYVRTGKNFVDRE